MYNISLKKITIKMPAKITGKTQINIGIELFINFFLMKTY